MVAIIIDGREFFVAEGSDSFSGSPHGLTAQRKFYGAWVDRYVLINKIFGFIGVDGDGNPFWVLSIKYPWNLGSNFSLPTSFICKPHTDAYPLPISDLTQEPSHACAFELTVQYEELIPYDGVPFIEMPDIPPPTLIRIRSRPHVDIHTTPTRSLKFSVHPHRTEPVGDDKVNADVDAGFLTHSQSIEVEWYQVAKPNWNALRGQAGTVNDQPFFGFPAQAVLFVGSIEEPYRTFGGTLLWRISMDFLAKTIPLKASGAEPLEHNGRIGLFNRAFSEIPITYPNGQSLSFPQIEVTQGGARPLKTSNFNTLFTYG